MEGETHCNDEKIDPRRAKARVRQTVGLFYCE